MSNNIMDIHDAYFDSLCGAPLDSMNMCIDPHLDDNLYGLIDDEIRSLAHITMRRQVQEQLEEEFAGE